jgi:hypothetical protein
VWDETARELCERFFHPLVQEKQTGKRDYKRAFFAAIDAIRHPAHLPLLEDRSQQQSRRSTEGLADVGL